jgi:hypothetical protein
MPGSATLNNIVRVGTVSSVDASALTARVAFADRQDAEGKPLISAPLKVIQSAGATAPQLPTIAQFVLCVFLPNGEGDGFVIGGI